jgi:hypothetical protein
MTDTKHEPSFTQLWPSSLGINVNSFLLSKTLDAPLEADIYVPYATADLSNLGLLGQIAAKPCIIEIFSEQPTAIEIQTSLLKLLTLRSNKLNQARKDNESIKEEDLPHLWILATSASDNLLDFLGAEPKPGWCQGVYFCGPLVYRTAIVAINRLPITPETLLVRLLGKGATQLKAINEIRALPTDNALRNRVERLIYRWRIYLDAQHDKDDKELLMNFQQIYQEHENKIVQEARREMVESMLKLRFGMIDEALSSVIERLLKLPPDESSRLLMQSDQKELLAKLSH